MKRKILKRVISLCLVAAFTISSVTTAYANGGFDTAYIAERERTGVPYVLQCETFDSQCGSSTIDGELVETTNIATLHDGIMSMLDEDTIINTTDYLGNSIISNEKDTYSINMYNVNAGEVNLSEVIVAENTMGFGASEVYGDGATLYSKNGDINFYCENVNFTGVIYAPNGVVRFEGSNININGVIIAKKIIVRAGTFNVNYNNSVAEMVDILDYTEVNEIYALNIATNGEKSNNTLQWEENGIVSSVDIYARYGDNGFEKIANVTDNEYQVSVGADYRIVVNTLLGEEITSNVVTLAEDEEGNLYEDVIDTDEDGIPDGYEYLIGTDAYIADTDEDGFIDGYEVFILYTNPLEADEDTDFDADAVKNFEEMVLGTNPYLADSDFDGISDNEDSEPVKANFDTQKDVDYEIPVKVGLFDLVSKYIDESGNKCEIVYDYFNGRIKYMSDSINASYNIYNDRNQLTATVEYEDGNVIANTYSYSGDNVETITHNGFQYQFKYDEAENMTDVKVGDRTLITNQYTDGRISLEKYGNGCKNEFVYDENGNVITQRIDGEIKYEWRYDENDNVIEYKDLLRNEVLLYTYDKDGTLAEITSDSGFRIDYNGDENSFDVSYECKGVTKNKQ